MQSAISIMQDLWPSNAHSKEDFPSYIITSTDYYAPSHPGDKGYNCGYLKTMFIT